MFRPVAILLRLFANLERGARALVAWFALPRDGSAWVVVRLAPPLDDLAPPSFPFGREPSLSFLEALEVLEAAAGDPKVAGVLLRFAGAPATFAKALSLRRAVSRLRDAGKPVAAYGESFQAAELVAASAATKIWLPEAGRVFLIGVRLETVYAKDLLERLGVRPEVLRVGSHKSAGETFTRMDPSPESREQTEALADDVYQALVDALADGRGLAHDAVRGLVDEGPYSARGAAARGIVDGCLYPDEIEDALADLAPERPKPRLVEASAYLALRARDPGWTPIWRERGRIACVVAHGSIHAGAAPRGIASDRMRRILDRLAGEASVRGVLLRLESPGGDAVASDLLWRSVDRLRHQKPVVVSLGEVAASGGYYMASGADAVYAESTTVTGSIGVVGGKLDLEGLYAKLGVATGGVERGARAGMLSGARSLRADERSALQENMADAYETFVDRVARGRGLSVEAVKRVAGGRVWSGARAHTLGLVDGLGGPVEALRDLRERSGLVDAARVRFDVLPRGPRMPGLRSLRSLFRVRTKIL